MAQDLPRSIVVASALESEASRAIAALRAAPAGCAMVELRADRLRVADVVRVVREVARPVLVSARRRADGGAFDGPETERRALLEAALAAGAAFVDVEWDASFATLAERPALRDRVVLSHHGGPCRIDALREMLARLGARHGGVAKLVPHATRVDDVLALRAVLAEARRQGVRLAAFATGRAGVVSRILGPAWGSFATYGSLAPGHETAAGQLPVDDMLDTYRVLELDPRTRLFGLVGAAVSGSPSPAMHAAGYGAAGIDACYLPIETDELDPAWSLVASLGLEALGVTRPFKETLARRCTPGDEVASRARAVNMVRLAPQPLGLNTDGTAALERVRRHVEPRDARVAILGSGGTARAFAAAFAAAGAHATLYGRTPERTIEAAKDTGVRACALERLADEPWDVLLHATPLGQDGARWLDPALLRGRAVLDAVYAPGPTALVEDARARGLAVVDGLELLAAQARLQFEHMTGRPARYETLHAAAERWLARRAS
jgi:3-dehydroquinate dehydratase / shikimate dehydrogenase